MKTRILTACFALLTALSACTSYEDEYKQAREELETMQAKKAAQDEELASVNAEMSEIDALLLEIEASEEAILTNLEEGTSYASHADRIRGVQDIIDRANEKVAKLEKALASSESNMEGFLATIRRLRGEVDTKDVQIQNLSEEVDKYKNQNRILIDRIELQKQLIAMHETEISEQNMEISRLNNELNKKTYESEEAKAQQHFLLAEKHEDQAKRYVLQRKKRREEFVEAYRHYKIAFDLGHNEAKARMDDLLDRKIIDQADVKDI